VNAKASNLLFTHGRTREQETGNIAASNVFLGLGGGGIRESRRYWRKEER